MSDDLSAKLELQIKEVEARFNQLDIQRKGMIEQRANFDRQINAATEEMIRLQGEWKALNDLKGNGKRNLEPTPAIPKGKKKSKKNDS